MTRAVGTDVPLYLCPTPGDSVPKVRLNRSNLAASFQSAPVICCGSEIIFAPADLLSKYGSALYQRWAAVRAERHPTRPYGARPCRRPCPERRQVQLCRAGGRDLLGGQLQDVECAEGALVRVLSLPFGCG